MRWTRRFPGLDTVLDRLLAATSGTTTDAYEAEVARAVQRVAVEHVITLATNAAMPQVRAIAAHTLERHRRTLVAAQANVAQAAHASLLAADIKRFLDRPAAPAPRAELPEAPPGAPIGEPAMEWLRRLEPPCSMWQQ